MHTDFLAIRDTVRHYSPHARRQITRATNMKRLLIVQSLLFTAYILIIGRQVQWKTNIVIRHDKCHCIYCVLWQRYNIYIDIHPTQKIYSYSSKIPKIVWLLCVSKCSLSDIEFFLISLNTTHHQQQLTTPAHQLHVRTHNEHYFLYLFCMWYFGSVFK